MLVGMKRVNKTLGSVAALTDVAKGIRMFDPELRVVEQPHHEAFVLYDVPESRALKFECAYRGLPDSEVPQGSKTKYGDYYGTVFHISAPGRPGSTLALLWAKENGNWKVISWESEPETDQSDVPDLRTEVAAGANPRVQGKPEQIKAARDFLDAWFIEKDYERAMHYVADECLECVNLFLREGEQPYSGHEALKERLRLGLQRTAEAFGSINRLSDVMTGFEPSNPHLPIVTHPDEADFLIASLPDYVAGSYGCAYRLAGGQILPAPENPTFGNHYVLGFKTRTFTGEPAVLFTLWSRRAGEWKISAFHIETP
jgi:hypothetical protein